MNARKVIKLKKLVFVSTSFSHGVSLGNMFVYSEEMKEITNLTSGITQYDVVFLKSILHVIFRETCPKSAGMSKIWQIQFSIESMLFNPQVFSCF